MSYEHDEYPLGQGSVDETPWPRGPHGGTFPPVSGDLVLQCPTAPNTARASNPPQPVCAWRGDEDRAQPLSLLVVVSDLRAGTDATHPYRQDIAIDAQGGAEAAAVQLAGVLRVTYGVGSAQRILECDLASGCYQLPPCTSAKVEAFLFGVGAINPVTVQAALTPGFSPNPARMRNTQIASVALAASKVLAVPFGARWVSLAALQATDIGAGQPSVTLAQSAGPLIKQDYVGGVFTATPGQAVELAGRGDVTLSNVGAAGNLFAVRFYLEP